MIEREYINDALPYVLNWMPVNISTVVYSINNGIWSVRFTIQRLRKWLPISSNLSSIKDATLRWLPIWQRANWLLIWWEKYDVTCVKMPKNEHKYRKSSFCEFAWKFIQFTTEVMPFQFYFCKEVYRTNFFKCWKISFCNFVLSLNKIGFIEILGNKELKGSCRYRHLCIL